MRHQQGLTLVEMMITLGILAILLTVVSPNVQSILQQNKVIADINALSAAAKFARFSAIDEQTPVTLCPTEDFAQCSSDWSLAKMAFIDANGNGQRESTESILTSTEALSKANNISGLSDALVFSENGSASTGSTVVICPSNGNVSYASALIVSLYGRVAVAQDNNNNGIKEDANGNDLTCS